MRWEPELSQGALSWACQLQGPRSFFSEIISSINDIKFSGDGRYILSRDYMTLKLWDMHMENAPVGVDPVHEVLRGKVRSGLLSVPNRL